MPINIPNIHRRQSFHLILTADIRVLNFNSIIFIHGYCLILHWMLLFTLTAFNTSVYYDVYIFNVLIYFIELFSERFRNVDVAYAGLDGATALSLI